MNDERYQLMYSGLAEGVDPDAVRASIKKRFKMPPKSVDKWLGQERAIIGKDLTKDQAWKTQYLLETAGVEAIVVPQTRSNLSLADLQLAPSQRANSANSVTVSDYRPTGLAEFDAQPLQRSQRAAQASRRRKAKSAGSQRSFKFTHFIAAAVMLVVMSYAGKHFVGDTGLSQPVASLETSDVH